PFPPGGSPRDNMEVRGSGNFAASAQHRQSASSMNDSSMLAARLRDSASYLPQEPGNSMGVYYQNEGNISSKMIG
ncbi:unnamed protein product, partial [Amoebophrya sp. A25]